MASVVMFVGWVGISLAAMAWAMAWAARRAGSPRGRLAPAAACLAVLVGVAVASAAVGLVASNGLAAHDPTDRAAVRSTVVAQLAAGVALLVAQLTVDLLVVRRAFRLNLSRALAPFGALLLVQVADLTFALGVVRPYLVEGFILPKASVADAVYWPPGHARLFR